MDAQVLIEQLAAELGQKALSSGLQLATAESCTAGGIAYAMTEVAGSSAWVDRGFVVYTARAKCEVLGVDAAVIDRFGVVSEQTAAQMARGALEHSQADLAVSVTGIAGPGGAEPGKPVGTVCFGFALRRGGVLTQTQHFAGNRREVRQQTIIHALQELIGQIDSV